MWFEDSGNKDVEVYIEPYLSSVAKNKVYIYKNATLTATSLVLIKGVDFKHTCCCYLHFDKNLDELDEIRFCVNLPAQVVSNTAYEILIEAKIISE